MYLSISCSSALNTETNVKVALKKLSRPFQSAIHAKRTYRELRLLKRRQMISRNGGKRAALPSMLSLFAIKSFPMRRLLTTRADPVASLRALAVPNVTDVIGGEVEVVTARVGDVGVERSLRGARVRSRPAG